MPAIYDDFGPYNDFVNNYIQFAKIVNPALLSCNLCKVMPGLDLGVDYKSWNINDLRKLANSVTGTYAFDDLYIIAKGANKMDSTGKFTADALLAQKALGSLTNQSVNDFYHMIAVVEAETHNIRPGLRAQGIDWATQKTRESLDENKIKILDQTQLNKMATSKDTVLLFNDVLTVALVAAEADKAGNYTPSALQAQKLLGEHAVDGNWVTAFKDIATVQRDTKQTRQQLMREVLNVSVTAQKSGAIMNLPKVDLNLNGVELKAINDDAPIKNQAHAVLALNANGVAISDNQKLETPAITRALEQLKAARAA